MFMYKNKAPMTVAVVISILALVCSYGILSTACPKAMENNGLMLSYPKPAGGGICLLAY